MSECYHLPLTAQSVVPMALNEILTGVRIHAIASCRFELSGRLPDDQYGTPVISSDNKTLEDAAEELANMVKNGRLSNIQVTTVNGTYL